MKLCGFKSGPGAIQGNYMHVFTSKTSLPQRFFMILHYARKDKGDSYFPSCVQIYTIMAIKCYIPWLIYWYFFTCVFCHFNLNYFLQYDHQSLVWSIYFYLFVSFSFSIFFRILVDFRCHFIFLMLLPNRYSILKIILYLFIKFKVYILNNTINFEIFILSSHIIFIFSIYFKFFKLRKLLKPFKGDAREVQYT